MSLTQVKHGPTSIGRYEHDVLKRENGWVLSDVLGTHKSIENICSLGPSVGVNENMAAINHPGKHFHLVDRDEAALDKSIRGRWPFHTIRISRRKTADEVMAIVRKHCDPTKFHVEGQELVQNGKMPMDNMSYESCDFNGLSVPDDSVDLFVTFSCLQSILNPDFSELHTYLNTIRRKVKDTGLLLNEWGLFRFQNGVMGRVVHPTKDVNHYDDDYYMNLMFQSMTANNPDAVHAA